MSGHVGDLTPNQADLLEKFRENVKDVLKPEQVGDDYFLTRWLRARKFDVEKAEHMYRTSMEFREKMGADTLIQDYTPPEVIQKYLTGGFCGFDKEGAPVRIELYGRLDLKGLMCSVKKSDLEKTKLLECERSTKMCEEQSKKFGRKVDGLTVVFDMANVGTSMLWKPGMQMYLHLVKILEDNYPEKMKRLLVVNAPRIFPLLYKLARPLVSEDMRQKIHVLGADYKHVLMKYIDEEQLPAFLGGKMCDPDGDPRCKTMICQGGEVPHDYYLQTEELLSHMTAATIPRGEKLYLNYDVQLVGSILRWEFKTEDYDVGFGVFFKGSGGNRPVVPVTRVNSHAVAEDGSFTCKEVGTYILCFDNSFSWAKSKKVLYAAEVISAGEDVAAEIKNLVETGDWKTLSERFETTHL
ncbi:hypothetical protein ScPMuIL_006585 [Solemya velum]